MWKNGWRIARTSHRTRGFTPRSRVRSCEAAMIYRVMHRTFAYPFWLCPLQFLGLEQRRIDPHPDSQRRRLRRGRRNRLGFGPAAGQNRVRLWVFHDVELLGRAVSRDSAWYFRERALRDARRQNGAVFGAVYANIAPALPLPPALRGPFAALLLWRAPGALAARSRERSLASRARRPAGAVRQSPGVRPGHLAPSAVRVCARRARAPAQRRARAGAPPPASETDYASNGSGTAPAGEHAVSAEPTPRLLPRRGGDGPRAARSDHGRVRVRRGASSRASVRARETTWLECHSPASLPTDAARASPSICSTARRSVGAVRAARPGCGLPPGGAELGRPGSRGRSPSRTVQRQRRRMSVSMLEALRLEVADARTVWVSTCKRSTACPRRCR